MLKTNLRYKDVSVDIIDAVLLDKKYKNMTPLCLTRSMRLISTWSRRPNREEAQDQPQGQERRGQLYRRPQDFIMVTTINIAEV
jgi:hypothetical protein